MANVTNVSDGEIDIDSLLLEAEQRLQNGPTALVAAKPIVTVEAATVAVAEPKQPEKKEKLSVRQAQKPKTEKKDTAGGNWFNLPKTDLTPEFKRDWQILRMRNILDPSQQKKALRAEPPKYSQVGEIIAGPTDYFSARLTKKERKQTLLGEAMGKSNKDKLKGKYAGIQKVKTSGKKNYYKKVVAQRRKRA